MTAKLEDRADEIKRLERCINELVAVLALPAIWTGTEPSQIASTLCDSLLGMLGLDFIYVRLEGPPEGAPIEMARVAPLWQMAPQPREIGQLLRQWLGNEPQAWPPVVQRPLGDAKISIVPLRFGLLGEVGLFVAGSRRLEFPEQTDRLVLSVAANQAAIGLREARLLNEQRQVASELDRRVAQRTRELSEANEELRKEVAERKRNEEKLRWNEEALREAHAQITQSEEQWRSVFENSAIGVGLADLNGRCIALNPVHQKMLGYSEEELQQLTFLDFTVEEDRERNWALFEELLAGKRRQFQIEKQYRRKDGSRVWVRNNVSLVPGSERVPRFFMTLSEDITERKQAEEALRNSERSFRLIVDGIAGLVAIMTAGGEVETVNRQLLEYFGKTAAELKFWPTTDVVHPDDLPRVVSAWRHSVEIAAPYDVDQRLRRVDGVYRWFHARGLPLRDADGHAAHWYVLLTDVHERKEAEEKLRRSEADLQEAQRLAHMGSWKLNALSGEVTVSPEVLRIYAVSAEEDTSRLEFWFDRTHPEDHARVRERFERCIREKADYDDEYSIVLPDGSIKYQHSLGRPVVDDHGNLVEFSGTTMEVTEQVQARAALQKAFDEIKKSEATLRQVVDAVPTLAFCSLPNGSTEFHNKRWLEYTGFSFEASRGWGWQSAIHPEDVPPLMERWRELLASGEPGEFELMRLRRHDGAYRWFLVRVEPFRDEAGEIVRWYGTCTDIDDRKRIEEQLRRSEAFLAEGQNLSRIGNFSWLVATDEIRWSEQLYRIFEFELGVPVTLGLVGSRIHPEDLPLLYDMIEKAQRAVSDFEYTHRLLMPDRSVKYLHLIAHGFRDKDGRLEYIGAVQDVTERRVSEEALGKLRSELTRVARITSLGALTASIAHEVSQPLSGIVTNAGTCVRMLNANPPNIDGALETARRTIRDGIRASNVITRLRTLYSKKDLEPELMDLNEATREIISLSMSELQQNRVILRQELAEDLPLITGDRVQLQQVILNLLRNASDAMSSVGDRPRELLVRTEREETNHVRLSVRDVGAGFTPQVADKLFEAFYTTKDDGMGVGLFVSRSIIEAHHGRLWATANEGQGATFSFSIPCGRIAAMFHTAGAY